METSRCVSLPLSLSVFRKIREKLRMLLSTVAVVVVVGVAVVPRRKR